MGENFSKELSSNGTGTRIHQHIKKETGCYDPYYHQKKEGNEIALSLIPKVREILEKDSSLETYVKIAIVGNILDFGTFGLNTEFESMISEGLEKELAINKIDEFEEALKKYDNVAVVQFDAHTDLRKQYLGEELTHSGVMYRIAELIGYENIAQIGLRSGEKEEFDLVKKYNTLKTKKEQLDKFKDKNIFLTIDLDVLDPSLMSGVGTPEAGGLTYLELMDWLMYLKNFNIIGADIMELAPDVDITKTSTATTCKLIREVLNLL